MALIDIAAREIQAKIVYYGPGLSGKTTNIQYISDHVPETAKGTLHSIDTEAERTLFFDFLPLDLPTIHGFAIRFHLYTVPGQVLYERTRLAVLNGADGVVFVADSRAERLEDNQRSLTELEQNLVAQGKTLDTFPLILQFNKRDHPAALSAALLEEELNTLGAPTIVASATQGDGVFATLRAICRAVIRQL